MNLKETCLDSKLVYDGSLIKVRKDSMRYCRMARYIAANISFTPER